jgi:maltose alpha-D-glucosyltransferase/alpha-amylase
MNYHFPLMPRLFLALARADRGPIDWILGQTPPIPPSCQWGIFLRNHDELTLEMVTDDERAEMYAHYVKDPRAKLNLGIRRRLAPLLDGDQRRIRLLFSLLLSLPGTPFIYYGDEIGMGDDLDLPDRDGLRTPMPWDDSPHGGFTTATRPYAPVIDDPVYGFRRVNVAAGRSDPDSLWHRVRSALEIRRRYRVFGRGDTTWLDTDDAALVAYRRSDRDQSVLVLANLADRTVTVEVPDVHDLFAAEELPAGGLELEPYGYRWLLSRAPGAGAAS